MIPPRLVGFALHHRRVAPSTRARRTTPMMLLLENGSMMVRGI